MSDVWIHRIRDEYLVAEDSQWLPGVYATEEAARYATRFDNDALYTLNRTRGVGDDYKPITLEDLNKLEVAQF